MWVGTASDYTEFFKGWYSAEDLGCSDGICAITPQFTLADGTYTWFVQAWGEGGFSIGGVDGWAQGNSFNP